MHTCVLCAAFAPYPPAADRGPAGSAVDAIHSSERGAATWRTAPLALKEPDLV